MPFTPSNFALIDCNNFFASCEQLFNPRLIGKPVVILSNNDGCIIARSREAKLLGIKMGEPAFKNRDLFHKKGVHVLSSNFTLYGDLSERVMTTLEEFGYPVEVYSIDEAFLHLPPLSRQEMEDLGCAIRAKIKKWIGIPIAVGLGSTKTLAKAANELAKKNKGVFLLVDSADVQNSLFPLPVEEVWGIGKRLSEALRTYGIRTIGKLIQCEDDFLQKRFSVTLVRTVWELRGIPCFQEEEESRLTKSIICSRSFGKKVNTLIELKEAVATYTAKAAVRLRAQEGCARRIQVFVCKDHLHSQSASFSLPAATDYTPELIHYAHHLLLHLFTENSSYKKAGIVFSELVPKTEIQPDLFNPIDLERRERIMQTLDQINRKFSRKTLTFAAEGLEQKWQARSANRSPRYTTSWNELPLVK